MTTHSEIGGGVAAMARALAFGRPVTYRRVTDRQRLDTGRMSGGNVETIPIPAAIKRRVNYKEANDSRGRLTTQDSAFSWIGSVAPAIGDEIVEGSDHWQIIWTASKVDGSVTAYVRR